LYYDNGSDDGKPYRIRIDGTGREKLGDTPAEYLNVDNGYLYFTAYQNGWMLIRQAIESAELTSYLQPEGETIFADYLNVEYDYIFYSDTARRGQLCCVSLDDRYWYELSSDKASFINIGGTWIYYRNADDGLLYRVSMDGNQLELVN
jgi:hypothetical protein